MEIDFNLNFSIHLANYLNDLKSKKHNNIRVDLFVEFINESINYLNAYIKDYNLDTKRVLYSSFKNFHQAHFTYELCNYFNIKDDSLQFFIEELEKLFANYISTNYKKLKENDIEGISKILGYFNSINSTKIDLFDFNKYEFVMQKDSNGNNTGYLVDNEKLYEENLQKLKIYQKNLILAFKNNINDFSCAEEILNFFYFFMLNNIEKKEIEDLLKDEKIWEIVIDEFHLLKIDEILSFAKLMKYYNVDYSRLWVFLQDFIRDYFVNLDYDNDIFNFDTEKKINFKRDFDLLRKFEEIFDEENFRLEDNVLLQFIYFLRNKKDEMIIKESYIFSKKEMI